MLEFCAVEGVVKCAEAGLYSDADCQTYVRDFAVYACGCLPGGPGGPGGFTALRPSY